MHRPYYSFNNFLQEKFGGKVRKIPIDAGFSCPNKDGTISDKGCIFCDTYGSGPIDSMDLNLPVSEQITRFIGRRTDLKYIAYLQAHSNACAPVQHLRKQYDEVFKNDNIVGLFLGTRPDPIAEDVCQLLEEMAQKTFLTVELGLQSIHAKSLEFLQRNHSYQQFLETFKNLKDRNIDVLVHLIIGIPGESKEDMIASVREMNRLKPAGVKFHMMHVLKDTLLFDLYEKGQLNLLEKEEYIQLIITLLEHLDPSIVVHRITGERDSKIYHAPLWALENKTVINKIRHQMKLRNTFQGARCPQCRGSLL